MAKRKYNIKNKETMVVQEVNEPKQILKPNHYNPPACSCCENLRPAKTNYSSVYCTTRTENAVYRYIKCRFCNNRFKDVTFI